MPEIISANDLRYGMLIDIEDVIYEVIEFRKVRTGKGGAFVSTKLRNFISLGIINKTFRAEEKLIYVKLVSQSMTYLYCTGESFYFMNNDTYEQIVLNREIIGKAINFLVEGRDITINFYNEKPIGVKLPLLVKLKVIKTEAGLKGDSVSNVTKLATLETGFTLHVPLFINEGDEILVDTRTEEYRERI